MKITLRGVRSIFFITALCMVFTMAFGLTGPDEAYAAVEEQVYEPFESAADILSGKDVPVSKSYQGLIQYNISSGGSRYKGSGQCWGYANKVKNLFGGGGRTKYVKKKSTAENIYKALKNVRPGTHVRFGNSKTGSGNHSIAVYKVTKDKIYFSEANWDHANGISHNVYDLESFSHRAYNYIMWYIQPTGGYKSSSTSVVGYSYDLSNTIEVAWRPVSGAKSYTVYRASSKNGKYTKLKTVKGTTYTDKKAKSGANYYKVKPNNRSMSSAKVIYNKLTPPTIHVNATKQGYVKLSWDKVKGAKKYGIYKEAYSSKKGYYYKLLKTTTGTSYTYKIKSTDTEAIYVKAIASNSDASSAYNYAPVHRAAPKGKIFSYEYNETYKSYDLYCGVAYDPTAFDSLELRLYRSEKKNGEYEQINSTTVYGDTWYGTGQMDKKDFKYKTTSVVLSDNYWEYGKTYYYKVEASCGSGWYSYSGLDSSKLKIVTPDISSTETAEAYGNGELHKYADGTLVYYKDANGNIYTRNPEELWWDELYFEDDNGQGYLVDKSTGDTYYATYDRENNSISRGDNVNSAGETGSDEY